MKLTKSHTDVAPHTVHVGSYVIGFVLSLALTLLAYFLVARYANDHYALLSHQFLAIVVMVLALTQFVVQLIFFLHIGREQKPKWNKWVLWFAILIVTILVAGSIWIMAHLDYNMQLDHQTDNSIIEDEGFSTSGHSH